MNINRRKNVFTLGDFHFLPAQNAKNKLKQRQNTDPFERDPFKIQSYNFRYAERPIFPIPSLQQRSNNLSSVQDCKTFFYNYNFPQNSNVHRSATYSDNRALNLTKFQEYRRKKFLQDPLSTRNSNLINSFDSPNNNNNRRSINIANNKPYNSNILNLYYGRSRPQQNSAEVLKSNYPILANNDSKQMLSQNNTTQNFNLRQNCSHYLVKNGTQKGFNQNLRSTAESRNPQDLIKNLTQPITSQTQHRTHPSLASTSRGEGINRRRSLSSGCEININIHSLENDSITDNVTINIETDSISNNLDMIKPNSLKSSNQFTQQLKHLESSKSFIIDKRLSKFSLNPERKELFRRPVETTFERKITSQSLQQQEQKYLRDRQRERIKALNSVYCPHSVQTAMNKSKTRMTKSSDRIPSMIPFRSKSDIGNYHHNKMENLSSTKKSFLQRVKDNLHYSLTDVKSTTKSKLANDLNSCSTNSVINEKKILNSSLLAAKQSFLKKFNASKHSSLHSLPVVDQKLDQKPISSLLYRNHSKLPVSVNINVFADKLKILKH